MADGDKTEQGRRPRLLRRRRVPLSQRLQANFLTGLVVVAPLVITIYLTWAFIEFVDARVVPWVPSAYNPRAWLNVDLPGFGLLIFLLATTFVGYLARKVFGRQLIRFGETLIDRMPIVRWIYNALKQIVETILSQSASSFQQACLIEYPRRGAWAIAFVATETKGELLEKSGEERMISLFLPTTPNPTSGFLLFVPARDVHLLDMTVEEAAKLVISAGLVSPPTKAEKLAHERSAESRRRALARAVQAGAPPPPGPGQGGGGQT
ncbi:MAG TPA: DUF502 domain-containing protein [Thermohalobaculum sp.]|nr:DUF502 domain-containing protein [Thermohalobaculum sp.]